MGKAIKLCRTQRGLSQQELADKADVSVSYLSLLERNKRDPALSTLESIADALGISFFMLTFIALTTDEKLTFDNAVLEKLSANALMVLR